MALNNQFALYDVAAAGRLIFDEGKNKSNISEVDHHSQSCNLNLPNPTTVKGIIGLLIYKMNLTQNES